MPGVGAVASSFAAASAFATGVCLPQPALSTVMTSIADVKTARVFMSVLTKSEPEDPDHAALARVPPDVFHEIGGRAYIGRIVRDHVAGEQKPVAPDSRVHRDVLLPVRRA